MTAFYENPYLEACCKAIKVDLSRLGVHHQPHPLACTLHLVPVQFLQLLPMLLGTGWDLQVAHHFDQSGCE